LTCMLQAMCGQKLWTTILCTASPLTACLSILGVCSHALWCKG
jgi:hypothetical protein